MLELKLHSDFDTVGTSVLPCAASVRMFIPDAAPSDTCSGATFNLPVSFAVLDTMPLDGAVGAVELPHAATDAIIVAINTATKVASTIFFIMLPHLESFDSRGV